MYCGRPYAAIIFSMFGVMHVIAGMAYASDVRVAMSKLAQLQSRAAGFRKTVRE